MMMLLLPVVFAGEVRLSGQVAYTGGGEVRVEVLRVQEGQLLLLASTVLPQPGPWSLAVPADSGPVRVRAAADLGADGIGPGDPQAVHPETIVVAGRDQPAIDLSIPRPDLNRSP